MQKKAFTAENWKNSYAGKNPVLRQVASLLVWSQDGKTFTLRDGAAICADGSAYPITSKKMVLAHPLEMEPEDVTAWQRYFTSNGIKQPFAQIWEPAVRPETVRENRYEGIEVPVYRFKGQYGISFDFDIGCSDLNIGFQDCGLEWENVSAVNGHYLDWNGMLRFGKFTFKKYTRTVNHIVSLLDKWTIIGRILKDDASIITLLDGATLAQIMEYIQLAIENSRTNVTAELLNYKNEHFPDFDPLAEFTLEDF